MSGLQWTAGGIAFVIALVSPVVLAPVLQRAGVVDVPNARSSHSHHAVRGGGVSQTMGIVTALMLAVAVTDQSRTPLLTVLAVAIASAALGWAEDVRGLHPRTRAIAQTATGLIVMLVVAPSTGHSPWWALLGGIAVIGLTNVVNFMDGVNGMSALHGIVFGSSFAVIGVNSDVGWLTTGGAVLAAAFAAFVPWNAKGRLFLGDVGSYLLGGACAIIVVVAWMQGLSVVALAAPFSIYVADTAVTLADRIIRGEKWYEAHRDHTYQRMNRHGLPHLAVSVVVAAASAATAALGIVSAESDGGLRLAALLAIVALILAYTALRFRLRIATSPQTSKGNS